MFDAAHAVREDHSSQGGFIAFITPDTVFHEETSYHVVDWRSFKLPRVARSSLSAEAQAAGQTSDAQRIHSSILVLHHEPQHGPP